MTTLSKLWRDQKGRGPARKYHAITDMVFSSQVGDPLLKKLDYSIM